MSEIKTMCKSLRLAHMAEIYEDIPFENPSQFLETLLSKELELREYAKVKRLIKKARFLQKKSLVAFQWHDQIHFPPQLDAEELKRLKFIQSKENLILTGSLGTGKTHLAIAVSYEACKQGIEVKFYRISDLVVDLEKAWKEGRLVNFQKKF